MNTDTLTLSSLPKGLFGIFAIFGLFLAVTLALKLVFVASLWDVFRIEGALQILRAIGIGLRFDISILSYMFIPAVILYTLRLRHTHRGLDLALLSYLGFLCFFILIFWLSDIQYFQEAGKHFTYEFFSYLNASAAPMISGAFTLHPWFNGISLAASLLAPFFVMRMGARFLPRRHAERPLGILPTAVVFIILASLAVIGARGGVEGRPIKISASGISSSPHINALCLNPLFAAFKSYDMLGSGMPGLKDEAAAVATVRGLLPDLQSAQDASYPLMRSSQGTPQGIRKNVVIFILESWSGIDIGALGDTKGLTPNFDALAHEGLLLTNFHATGIRTSEGIFSILTSFPNQPNMPVLKTSLAYQRHWRPLSGILAAAGYSTLFIHGRDLEFDDLSRFLRSIHFQKIVDRKSFPKSVSTIADSWPGYSDEEVMRRADLEFAAQGSTPFLGVIYTMNTHPPFVTPEGFPPAYPADSVAHKFYNSLRYSDHTLKVFFDLARPHAYFRDTIFIFVADHSRTHDTFNYCNQHHIPFLIYAPGYVKPGRSSAVAGQLDILPTVLDLLQMKTEHASWGQSVLNRKDGEGFAISISGSEARWRDSGYVLNDSLSDKPPLMFDIRQGGNCSDDIWTGQAQEGNLRKKRLRDYLSLSQELIRRDRVFPPQTKRLQSQNRSQP